MKKSIAILALAILSFALVQNATAQATATQTVSLQVSAVYEISTSGNPSALIVNTGTAGTNA